MPLARAPVVLDPAHVGGWFEGRAVASWDPVTLARGLSVDEAAEYLDAAYAGRGHELCVVVADYDGSCTVLCYEGCVVSDGEGWVSIGEIDLSPLSETSAQSGPDHLAAR